MALLKPILSPGRLNFSCCVGRRKSASMRSVFFPALAIKIARLAAVTLLPSRGTALVTNSERSGLSTTENPIFVRRMRYDSLLALCPFGSITSSLLEVPALQIVASTGKPIKLVRASFVRTRVSNCSNSTASNSPKNKPAINPPAVLSKTLG